MQRHATFDRVRPVLDYDLARYPTRDAFSPELLARHAPSRAWVRRMGLASAVLAACNGGTNSADDDDDFTWVGWGSGDDTGASGGGSGGGAGAGDGGGSGGGVDTGGIDGEIGPEYRYYVSEEEAWSAIVAYMTLQGWTETGEERPMVDPDGVEVLTSRAFVDEAGTEVLVGAFESYPAMQVLVDSPEYSADLNACFVVEGEEGCNVAWCGERRLDLPSDSAVCAGMGQNPYGDFYTWEPIELDPAEIYGPALASFLDWAAAQGLL